MKEYRKRSEYDAPRIAIRPSVLLQSKRKRRRKQNRKASEMASSHLWEQ